MIAYKVVTAINKRYYSYNEVGIYKVTYNINSWSFPKIGKLFVFKRLKDAKSFGGIGLHTKYFRCQVKGLQKGKSSTTYYNKVDFWDKVENGEVDCDFGVTGTYYTKAVKLLKEIK